MNSKMQVMETENCIFLNAEVVTIGKYQRNFMDLSGKVQFVTRFVVPITNSPQNICLLFMKRYESFGKQYSVAPNRYTKHMVLQKLSFI